MAQLLVYFRQGHDQQAKQIEKELELAGAELTSEDAAIQLGKVDISEHKKAAKAAGIDPADSDSGRILAWRRGKKLKLGPNGYDARSIVNFVRYLTAEVSKKLNGPSEVNEWLRSQESSVILGLFSDASRPSHNVWMREAEGMRPPYRFAEASVADAQQAKLFAKETLDPSKNQFAVVRPHKWLGKDEAPYLLSPDFKTMKTFVDEHAITQVYPYVGTARARWRRDGRAVVIVCLDLEKMGKMFKYVVNRLHKVRAGRRRAVRTRRQRIPTPPTHTRRSPFASGSCLWRSLVSQRTSPSRSKTPSI